MEVGRSRTETSENPVVCLQMLPELSEDGGDEPGRMTVHSREEEDQDEPWEGTLGRRSQSLAVQENDLEHLGVLIPERLPSRF